MDNLDSFRNDVTRTSTNLLVTFDKTHTIVTTSKISMVNVYLRESCSIPEYEIYKDVKKKKKIEKHLNRRLFALSYKFYIYHTSTQGLVIDYKHF